MLGLASVAVLTIPGTAAATYPGANGRIVFVHDPGPADDYDVFTMNPDGSDRVALTTDPGNERRPKYSADGERIVFERRPEGSTNNQIWVMNHDGTAQTQITNGASASDSEPMFSPDGSRIAFERRPTAGGRAQIYVVDADGANVVQLTFPGPGPGIDQSLEPSYSPDGSRIVFSRRSGATNLLEVWVMNADGSGQTKLTTASATTSDLGPGFSPDGQRIAYDHFTSGTPPNEDIFVINADGSGQAQVTSGGGQDYWPVFAPNGTRVLFERETQDFTHSNVVIADPTGLDLGITPLADNPVGVYDSTPDWQPLNPPACSVAGEAKQRSLKRVSVTVTCDEDVSAVAEGRGSAPRPKLGAPGAKPRTFQIPAVGAELQPATATTITLAISKRGRKALKKAAAAGKKGKATITLTLTDDLGQASSDSLNVVIKRKRRK